MTETDVTKFNPARMFNVATRVLKQITRDHRTVGMIVVMPVLIMIIFGVALSGEVKNLDIMVDNSDNGPLGSNILASLQTDDRVEVHTGDYQHGMDKVEGGVYFASIRIPNNFTADLQAKLTTNPDIVITLEIYVDATKPQLRGTILAAVRDALADALPDAGISINETPAFSGKESSGLDVSIPAVTGFVLTFLVLLLSLLTLIRERIGGTQFRLFTTPLSKTERLLGYVLALAFFGLIEVLAIMVISVFVFGAAIEGSFVLLVASAFLFALVNVLLSVFLSNFAENELQAVQMAPLIALPSMALSGMLVPVNSLPDQAQLVSNIIPLKYGIRIFEGIMLKGFGFAELWLDYVILLVFISVFFGLSLLTVKDKME